MGTQKVVIPKGLVNPNETTIIEIPVDLKHLNTVVAKPKQDFSFPSDDGRSYPKTPPQSVTKRTYTRKTLPRAQGVRMDALFDDRNASFGGRPYEDPADESSHGFHPYAPPSPVTPEPGSYYDFRPYQNLRDYYPKASTPIPYQEGDLSWHPNGTQPGQVARSPCAPAAGRPAARPAAQPDIYKTSITTSTPQEISTTEITEERFGGVDYSSINPDSSYSYRNQPSQSVASSKSPGSSGTCPAAGGRAAGAQPQGDFMNSLGNLESTELNKLMTDLSDFQSARRKLVFDASSLANAADVSKKLINCCRIS